MNAQQIILKKFLERQTARELAVMLGCLAVFTFNYQTIQWLPLGLLALAGVAYFYYRASQCMRLLARGSGWLFAFLRINGLAWFGYILLAGIYLFDTGVI